MILAGDIGGTKTVLALFEKSDDLFSPVVKKRYKSSDYKSFDSILRNFVSETSVFPEYCCLGVAGPVRGNSAEITNLGWTLQASGLSRITGSSHFILVNDLVATGAAVPFLGPSDIHTLQTGQPEPGGTIAVIAPGTGLGESFLTWDGSEYTAHPSEGGHVNFAPVTPEDDALLEALRAEYVHVSVEKICSGMGIPTIYRLLPFETYVAEPEETDAFIERAADKTPAIVDAARSHNFSGDFRSVKTLEIFVRILGREAGDLALKTLSTGGIYIGGGIPPRIIPALEKWFLTPFREKGKLEPIMAEIPVNVIISQDAALTGAMITGIRS